MSQTTSTSIPFDRLPLGFRFRPTDEELINNYLKLKINGRIKPSDAAAVAEVDVCRLEPWDLPEKSAIRSDDQEWFFFAPVDRKYPSGNRSNRATEAGYWKATGRDRFIRSRSRDGTGVVGMKKTLVFHMGRAPRGKRTRWIMHEYRTVEHEFEEGGFVLFRLFRKPEERVSGTITPEPEESGFSPIPINFSPIDTLHINDFVEGEYAAPLNENYPESNLQEGSQPLRETINNQFPESKQDDKAYYLIPYPNYSEESHSNYNTTTYEHGQMAERKDPALYDELLGFLGPEYEHLFFDEFPQLSVISSDIPQILHAKLEEDSVHDILESILSIPEISSGLSANETGSATMVADIDSGALVEETEINIKLRELEKLSSSTDFDRQQGTAERRIKLVNSKSTEEKFKNKTTINEVSEPALFVPCELPDSDIQPALSLQEHENPPRLRSRQRKRSVRGNKMEGSSLHRGKSRVHSIPTRRIGFAVLAIASLICAGAVWYFNS